MNLIELIVKDEATKLAELDTTLADRRKRRNRRKRRRAGNLIKTQDLMGNLIMKKVLKSRREQGRWETGVPTE